MVRRDFLGKKHSVQFNLSHRLYWYYHKNAGGFLGFELIFLKFLTNEPKCINSGTGVIFMSVGKQAVHLNFVFSLSLTALVTPHWQQQNLCLGFALAGLGFPSALHHLSSSWFCFKLLYWWLLTCEEQAGNKGQCRCSLHDPLLGDFPSTPQTQYPRLIQLC